jgi:hypothetical protein
MVRSVDLDESSDQDLPPLPVLDVSGGDFAPGPRASTPVLPSPPILHIPSPPSTPSVLSDFDFSPPAVSPPVVAPADDSWLDVVDDLFPGPIGGLNDTPVLEVSSDSLESLSTVSVASGYSSPISSDSLSGRDSPAQPVVPFVRPPPSPDVSVDEGVPVPVPPPLGGPQPPEVESPSDSDSSDGSDHSADPSIPNGPMRAFNMSLVNCAFQPLRTTAQSLARLLPKAAARLLKSQSPCTYLSKRTSCGRPICLAPDQEIIVKRLVSGMLDAGIIRRARRQSFVSYPFLVPKASGAPRLVVDYSHLRGLYKKPTLYLPSFCAALRRLRPDLQGRFMARIDLRDAFYSVPIPKALAPVSAFRVGASTYVFNALPMGLFVSPRLLQAAVQQATCTVSSFTWVHMDDIFVAGPTAEQVHSDLIAIIRNLHLLGFNLSPKKSQLMPCLYLRFCGLLLDTTSMHYEVGHTHLAHIRRLLFSQHRLHPSVLGYISYWLYAVHLTAAVRRLVSSRPDLVWKLLSSGPWPLPRPPERLWATDASLDWMAAVDHLARPIFMLPAPAGKHIYQLEMVALYVAALVAPPHTAVFVDNTAVIGALRRSSHVSSLLIWLSLLRARKDLVVVYIPSAMNPADIYTREKARLLTLPYKSYADSLPGLRQFT